MPSAHGRHQRQRMWKGRPETGHAEIPRPKKPCWSGPSAKKAAVPEGAAAFSMVAEERSGEGDGGPAARAHRSADQPEPGEHHRNVVEVWYREEGETGTFRACVHVEIQD